MTRLICYAHPSNAKRANDRQQQRVHHGFALRKINNLALNLSRWTNVSWVRMWLTNSNPWKLHPNPMDPSSHIPALVWGTTSQGVGESVRASSRSPLCMGCYISKVLHTPLLPATSVCSHDFGYRGLLLNIAQLDLPHTSCNQRIFLQK